MVRITEITPALFPDFYNCFEVLMQEGYAGFPPKLKDFFIRKEYSQANFILWYEKKFRVIFLAINEYDKVVGFLVGDNTYGGIAFITWIGVLPAYRKKGLGSQLFHYYENYVKAKRAHLIELFTYEAVKDFYIKHGFTEVGRRESGFFGQTNIIMNKKIGDWNEDNIPLI
jgi:ribosomal protein S18 acetylase RimI-like enzyme